MIPKFIHQIWLDKNKLMPKTVFDCIRRMRSMNPSVQHKLWTYDDIEYLNSMISENALRGINILKSKFEENSNKANVFMSGIYRIAIASKFGGLYVDSDIRAYKPFPDEIFNKRLFLVVPVPGARWILMAYLEWKKTAQKYLKLYSIIAIATLDPLQPSSHRG